jgi:PBSX family phage terminase large subunit
VTDVSDLLSPKQVTSITESTADINVWNGAIRSGKTIASLLRWLMYVADPPAGSGELVMIGKTAATVARNCFASLQDPSIFGNFTRHVHYTAGAPTAKIMGRTVHVIGANDAKAESKIRGFTCRGAYVDELTLLPRPFWDQLVGRHSGDGTQIFATTNPDNPQHWVKKDILTGNPDVKSWHFVMDDNPKLSAEKKAFWRRQYTGLWFKRFILGQWVQAEGACYDMWDEDVHVIDELPPILRWIGVGIDYGTTNPFAGLLLGLGADGILYLASEYRWDSRKQRRQKTDSEYSSDVRAWVDAYTAPGSMHPGVIPEKWIVDPSAASFMTQLWRDGLSPEGADNSVLDGIRLVSNLLAKGQLKVHRSCAGWIEEAPGYVWDAKAAERGEDRPMKVGDHSLDGGRYVINSTEWT